MACQVTIPCVDENNLFYIQNRLHKKLNDGSPAEQLETVAAYTLSFFHCLLDKG